MAKYTNNNIPNLKEDWNESSTEKLPYSGKSVQKFIKDKLAERGTRLNLVSGREDDSKYSVVLLGENTNGEEVELSRTPEFSIGDTSNLTKIIVQRVSTENPTIKTGDSVRFTFFYDHVDGSGVSTGIGATAEVSISHGSTRNSYNLNLTPGRNYTIDPTQYLAEGPNTIKVVVTTNDLDNKMSGTVQWTAVMTELSLSSEYDITNGGKPIVRGDVLNIDYGIKGTGNVTTYLYVDGNRYDSNVGITNAGRFTYNTNVLNSGIHTLQLVSELDNAGTILKSNSIEYVITVTDESYNNSLSLRFDYPDGRIIEGTTATLLVEQYAEFTLPYTVGKSTKMGTGWNVGDAVAQIYVNGETLSSATLRNARTEFSYKFANTGTLDASLYVSDPTDQTSYESFNFTIEVAAASFSISEPEGGVELVLNAVGKTNTAVDKDSWSYENVRTTFEGVSFENGSDGWSTDESTLNALTVANGGKVTVGYKPFDINVAANEAYSLVIRFKSDVVTNEDGVIISAVNDYGLGLTITSQEVKIVTSENTIARQFASGEPYEVAIVDNIASSSSSSTYIKKHSSMLYVYINGELCGAAQRKTDSLFHNNAKNIVISGEHARTSVYVIRAYRRSLTPDEVLNLYMIDMGDSTKMLETFEKNNIADDSGNVTIDKVKARATVPYMIITGNTGGMSTVMYAAAGNNKKPKYDLLIDNNTPGEILYVDPVTPAANFHLKGGCIRLQGTSSLTYPIKNYRIYFKDSNKVAGELHLGCDEFGEGGELQEKSKYALRGYKGETPSIPVDCFCLKADYAESSSSHNTGFAVLINNTLKRAGEYTPAQKYKNDSYPYDVRTTVDGFPIYLFYRKTLADTPTFLGKFNFNNDKSTESVFGFLDIPGYHDNSEYFPNGENPTECWEFKNNSNPMGGFHFDKDSLYNKENRDFSFDSFKTDTDTTGNTIRKYDWVDCWEARFPDDDDLNAVYEAGEKVPTYLSAVANWINSTDTSVEGLTNAEINARKTKFRQQLANYFDVDYLCDYYISTVIVAAVDQQIKNMMLGFWYNPEADNVFPMGKVRGYFIFYDNDTILGVRNDGQLKYKWDIDENTIDQETGDFAFAGARSTLWVNLRTEFSSKIQEAYLRLRGANLISFDTMNEAFTVNQTDKFPERMYNIDAVNKYISPLTEGVTTIDGKVETPNFLDSLQGSRKYHRNWWVSNRLDMLDATYLAGDYKSTRITFKGVYTADVAKVISVIPSRDWYFAIDTDNEKASKTTFVKAGETFTFTRQTSLAIGDTFNLYGVKFAKKMDFSLFTPYFSSFALMQLPFLEEIVFGSINAQIAEYTTANFEIGANLPLLKKISVVNHTKLTRLDLSQCSQIEEFDCTGCTLLVTVSLPSTATLKKAYYGSGVQTITLVNKKNVEEISAESFDDITTITLDGSNETCVNFVFSILNYKLI